MSTPKDGHHVRYSPCHAATPASELSALADVYEFILHCHTQKEGGPETAPNDAKKESERRRLCQ